MFPQRPNLGATVRQLARSQARCWRWQCNVSGKASYASSSGARSSPNNYSSRNTAQPLLWAAGLAGAGAGASLYGFKLHTSSSAFNPLALDSDSLPNAAEPAAKRASYSDRIKAHKGGPVEIRRTQQALTDSEQAEALETSAESHSANFANLETEAAEESGQEGAYDPDTGRINWDCPCLGGMAYGPCGEQFKKSFSCFIFSETEPKGKDCIESFMEMQDCFREHPEVYAEELKDDEWDEVQDAGDASKANMVGDESSSTDSAVSA